jgi:prophage regulatory protein
MERTELRKTTIYKLQKEGRFPRAVSLTGHSVRWIESEVEEWLVGRQGERERETWRLQRDRCRINHYRSTPIESQASMSSST